MPRKEGFTLKDVRIELNGEIVGGVQSMTVEYAQENTVYDEAGNAMPLYVENGNVRISGTVEKLTLDYDFITSNFDLSGGDNPYFTLVGVNQKNGDTVTVVDCKFRGFTLNFALNDATNSSLPYDALRLRFR